MPKKRPGRATDALPREHWKREPDEHDYPAAVDYLALTRDEQTATSVVGSLRTAPIITKKAKDLLRASRLELLPKDNARVAADLRKFADGERLSPVLLVREDVAFGLPLVIADGYHRICASSYIDENADVPCRITDLAPPSRSRRPPSS
jgi:hypothetical protein